MLPLFVIAPLLFGGFISLFMRGRSHIAGWTAFAFSIASLALAAYAVLYSFGKAYSITWFAIGGLTLHISMAIYSLNAILLMLVALIAPLIMLYSIGYMDVPSERPRFFFEISIFAASMMLFAISANFITMFIAWEMLGITSYLLIGFWYHREKAPYAARKSITTILIGDMAMLAAMVVIWNSFHTFNFYSIMASPYINSIQIPLLLILAAVFTKSAQFPFHEWLADAMEGPTPVSAFLHSSTMVKAGVFLVALLLPLFYEAHLLYVILAFGIATAFIGATNAIAERHIKKILAYSTMEDLGIMLVALGLHALLAAMLFFIVQTFYKALLFMSAGSIMKANNNAENIYLIKGSSKNRLLFISTLFGVGSIAGIFPLSGFFGKVAIDSAASNIYVYILLTVVEFASSIYIFRWLFIPMRDPLTKGIDAELTSKYQNIPKTMLFAIAVLAFLVVVGAFAYAYLPNLPYSNAFINTNIPLHISFISGLVETIAVLLGLSITYYAYVKMSLKGLSSHRILHTLLYNSIAVNWAYSIIASAVYELGGLVNSFDYALYWFMVMGGDGTVFIAEKLRRVVNGQINTYAVAFAAGIILLIIIIAV
ncbi:MAG: NADH-quinone oxidoreductase subunit L [Candidatus Marsarchaeota archaeon]|nr:NADH-quinone oxidoreductase subunit L [Candidatus Marsarchaeota archaeon]